MVRRTRPLLAVIGCLALVVAACAKSSNNANSSSSNGSGSTAAQSALNSAGPPQPGGTITIALGAETDGWNPTSSQWAGQAYQVAQTIFDPLVAYGDDLKPHPYLAESITANADNTVWTIKLRSGISFHDGEPLNSDAVKLQLDKDKASFLVGQALRPIQSIDKVDDLTVQVTMSQPWAAFPAAIAGQAGFIAAPAQLNATGSDATDKPIGTGPYEFKEWVRDDHLTVTKAAKYWREGIAYADSFVFKVITDDQSQLSSLQTGQVDEMTTGVANVYVQAQHDSSLQRVEYDTDPTTMIMLNTSAPPLDDIRVRQALSLATDREQVKQIVGRGNGVAADGPYLSTSPWYSPSGYPDKPDVTKATSLVNAYKQDKGITGSLKFTLGCTPTPNNQQTMDLIKQQWAAAGIDVDVSYTEQATYINSALSGNYQANCWLQLGATDPDSDSIWWRSENANPNGQLALNFMRLKDPEIDAALDAGRRDADLQQRKDDYAKVWQRFTADLPYIWLLHPHAANLFSSRVHGLGSVALPDGTKPLLFKGAVPSVIPTGGLWVEH